MIKKIRLLLALLFVVCIVSGVGYYVLTKPRPPSLSVVVKDLQEVNRLETSIYTAEHIIDLQKESGNFISELLFGDSILLIAHGKVVAGIDLSTLSSEDFIIEGSRIEIDLPDAKIFSSYLDEEKTRVYDRKTGLFTQSDITLETKARQTAIGRIELSALESGILEQANDSAKKQLKILLNKLGFSEVILM